MVVQHGLRDGVHVVARQAVVRHLDAEAPELAEDDGRELVLDEPLGDLVAGGDEADGPELVGQQLQQRRAAADGLRLAQALFVDDERDHAHAGELVARPDGDVRVPRGDHELVDAVHCLQPRGVDTEKPFARGGQLDLALLGRRGGHVRVLAQRAQAFGGLVLVEHARGLLPDEERLLAHAEQNGDIFLRDHMALAEARILRHARDDLRHVMAEHMTDSVDGFDFFHVHAPRVSVSGVIGVR